MGAKGGVALKFVQWFLRGITFCCAAIVLGIFSYFLATLHNHNLPIATWIRAVEGISGAATLYSLIGLLLLCCLAGRSVTSFIAIALDVAFAAAFIYVAAANRTGASSCSGIVDTPFGTGDADTNVSDNGNAGFTNLPRFRTACKLQSACLAVSIVAVIFFLLSAVTELALARHHHKEKRFGPSPDNNYTSSYGKKKAGFFSRFSKNRRSTRTTNTSMLPEHTHPDQVRDSYATETTRVGDNNAGLTSTNANKYGEAGYHGHHHGHHGAGGDALPMNQPTTAHYPEGNYRYDDGVVNARQV